MADRDHLLDLIQPHRITHEYQVSERVPMAAREHVHTNVARQLGESLHMNHKIVRRITQTDEDNEITMHEASVYAFTPKELETFIDDIITRHDTLRRIARGD